MFLGVSLGQRVFIQHEVFVELFQQLVVALDLVEHLLRGPYGFCMAFVLVIDEEIQWLNNIDLYLLINRRNLLRELIEDIDDILTKKNNALIFSLIDFQLLEKLTASIGDVRCKSTEELDYGDCEVADLRGTLLIAFRLFGEDRVEQRTLLDQQFSHSNNNNSGG